MASRWTIVQGVVGIFSLSLIGSQWYQGRAGSVLQIASDQSEQTPFEKGRKVSRPATSVAGADADEGGELIVANAPHAPQATKEVESEKARAGVARTWNEVMSTLGNIPGAAGRLVTMEQAGAKLAPAPGARPVAAATAATTAAGATPRPGVREVFFGASAATACQAGATEFSLTTLMDLHVCVVFGGLAQTDAPQLTFMTPDGHVYQQVTLAGAGPGLQQVAASLPVAGTYISQYNLVGPWTVQVSLNGQLLDQISFTLLGQ
jgi:hypothetical protein